MTFHINIVITLVSSPQRHLTEQPPNREEYEATAFAL